MDLNDLVRENQPMGTGINGPTLALGDAPAVRPPIKISADLPASSIPAAKAVYRKTGAYTDAEIEAAFAAFVPDKTQGPIINASLGVALSGDAQQRAYQTAFDHATDKGAVLAEAHRAGVQIKAPNGQFLAADGVEGNVMAYNFKYNGAEELDPGDLQAFDAVAKSGMSALHIPQDLAQSALTAWVDTANALPDEATDEELAAIFEREGTMIRGLENGPEVIRLSQVGDEALRKSAPNLHAAISTGWGFHSASSILALSRLGAHIERSRKS